MPIPTSLRALFCLDGGKVTLGSALANPLAKKFSERNVYILSLLIFIVCLLAIWLFPMNYISFMALMFVGYLGYAMPDALSVAMYSATVEYGEWKTGKNARGFIMSLISFPIKTAILLRSVVITAILAWVGYVADMSPTPELVNGIKSGITLIPALVLLVGMVLILSYYKITPQKLEQLQKEIAARKVGQTV